MIADGNVELPVNGSDLAGTAVAGLALGGWVGAEVGPASAGGGGCKPTDVVGPGGEGLAGESVGGPIGPPRPIGVPVSIGEFVTVGCWLSA